MLEHRGALLDQTLGKAAPVLEQLGGDDAAVGAERSHILLALSASKSASPSADSERYTPSPA